MGFMDLGEDVLGEVLETGQATSQQVKQITPTQKELYGYKKSQQIWAHGHLLKLIWIFLS